MFQLTLISYHFWVRFWGQKSFKIVPQIDKKTSSHSRLIPRPIFDRCPVGCSPAGITWAAQNHIKTQCFFNFSLSDASLAPNACIFSLIDFFYRFGIDFWRILDPITYQKSIKNRSKINPKRRSAFDTVMVSISFNFSLNQQAPKPPKSLKNHWFLMILAYPACSSLR